MPSLPELARTLEERLEALRATAAAVPIGGMSHIVTMQLLESASDLDAAARSVGEAHRRAIPVFRQGGAGLEIPANDGARTLLRQPPELQTLAVLLKAWTFFVRAFCDNAYQLLLASVERRPAKAGGSMEAILNERNPVAVLFAEEAPEIVEWFRELRAVRNDMKRGAAFAFSDLDARGLHYTIYDVKAERAPAREIKVTAGRTVTFANVVEDAARVLEIFRVISEQKALIGGAVAGPTGAQTGAQGR